MFRELNLLLLLHDYFVILLTNYILTFILTLVTGCGIERGIFGIKSCHTAWTMWKVAPRCWISSHVNQTKGESSVKDGGMGVPQILMNYVEWPKDLRIILKWIQESMPWESCTCLGHTVMNFIPLKARYFCPLWKLIFYFCPQIIPVWRSQRRSLVFLGENLRFLDVLSAN